MICYKCGNDIPSDSEYCPFCGIKLFVTCPKCGHTHSSQYPICNKCGTNRANYVAEQQRLKEEEIRREKQRIEEQRIIEEEQKRIAAERLAKERAIQEKKRSLEEEKAKEAKIRSGWCTLTDKKRVEIPNCFGWDQIKTYKFMFKYRYYEVCSKRFIVDCVFPANIIVPSEVKRVSGFNYEIDDKCWLEQHMNDIIEGPSYDELTDARQRIFSSLHSLEFQEGVEAIGSGAFANCDSLFSLSLPNSLKSIGRRAFSGCHALKEIRIPDDIETIKEGAFSGCSPSAYFVSNKFCPLGERFLIDENVLLSVALNGTDTIIIPDGIIRIGAYSYGMCRTLKHVTIPHSITVIGRRAFYECSSLESILIHDNITLIEREAFCGCTSLRQVTITTRKRTSNQSRKSVEVILQALSEVDAYPEIVIRVPKGCGYDYRHYPKFQTAFEEFVSDDMV